MTRPFLVALVIALPLPVVAGSLCVGNETTEALLFAVESKASGERVVSELDPHGRLCIDTPDDVSEGVVSVFASLDAEEGCSRLVVGNESETLIDYSEFDRCEWSSHQKN
jgi:hypothetical protein